MRSLFFKGSRPIAFALSLALLFLGSISASAFTGKYTTWSIFYTDGSLSIDQNQDRPAYEELLIESISAYSSVVEDDLVYQKYEKQSIADGTSKANTTTVPLGFAPNFRREQWETVDALSRKSGLPGFDAKDAKTLNVIVGTYRLQFQDTMSAADVPYITHIGVYDEGYKTLLGACIQFTSTPLQTEKGKRFTENTLYPINQPLEDSYADFMDVYDEYVIPLPGGGAAFGTNVSLGGSKATAKQEKALAAFFAKHGWKELEKYYFAGQRRPSVVFGEHPLFDAADAERILALSKTAGSVKKSYRLSKDQSRFGISEFYHFSGVEETLGVPYLVDYCATMTGSESKGYKIELAWLRVTPGKWNDYDNYRYSWPDAEPALFAVNTSKEEIEEFVDDAPGKVYSEEY